MPITAYSNTARRELDVEQWLEFNSYDFKPDSDLAVMPSELRERVTVDIECSCCGARGATLVRGARSKGSGKSVAQPHFRFRSTDGSNPHNPLCDFYDEQKVRGAEYLTNFANDRSELTRAIRELVCRGIGAGLFAQADMREMRQWFLQEKAAHSVPLDVTAELLNWCANKDAAGSFWSVGLPFIPDHGSLPGFDWNIAARREWVRRIEPLFAGIGRTIYFRRQTIERPLRLVELHAGQSVLDPTVLRDKYDAAWRLASFVTQHLFGREQPPAAIVRKHPSEWGATGHALLAFSALLLFKCEWELEQASALFCSLQAADASSDGLEGNLIGLNPFHDYHAWQVINAARLIAAKRIDARPVSVQIADVRSELQARYQEWATQSG